MNKKMREILSEIQRKTAEAKSFMDGENKDIAHATSLMDEVDVLQKEFDTEKRLYDAEKMSGAQRATATVEDAAADNKNDESPVAKFAKAVRSIVAGKGLVEGIDADGGYTVPEDVSTRIEYYKDVDYALESDIDVVTVITNKGSRTFQKKSDVDTFVDINENGAITNELTAPKFERHSYAIQDRAGFMPVSNDLIEDSDANILEIVSSWLGKADVATTNSKILAEIAKKTQIDLSNIDGIKTALNVTLGQAYKNGAKIYTNDDGLNYFDTLKDENGRPLLNPDPTSPAKLTLRCGTTVLTIKVIPNKIFASASVYGKTKDSALVTGKTYYTLSGTTYTAVATPNVSDIGDYYEITGAKVPFIVGNLYDYVRKYVRKGLSIGASTVASIGNFNAFAQNMTLLRAIVRDDYRVKDEDSIVNGYIEVSNAGE